MSFCWRLLVPASVVLVLLAAPGVASADDAPLGMDLTRADRARATTTLFGFEAQERSASEDVKKLDSQVDATLEKLEPIADYHPETDRWTERNNRIKISLWGAGWFFSQNLNIAHDAAVGLRVAWEVPGFIAIRLDGGFCPWSHLLARVDRGNGFFSDELVPGLAVNSSLTIGIFNPELSTAAGPLAFWAGFGPEIWYWNYHSNNVTISGVDHQIDFSGKNSLNFGGQIFVEADFKVMDIMHFGLGFKEHIVVAPQVKDGRYWTLDGGSASNGKKDNMGLAAVQDVYLQLSVLF
jgi:hypothetical protein